MSSNASPFSSLDTSLLSMGREKKHEQEAIREKKPEPAPQQKAKPKIQKKKEEIRALKSQSMIFYADQLQVLTHHSLQSKMNGTPISVSQMMREALDDYIDKHNLKK